MKIQLTSFTGELNKKTNNKKKIQDQDMACLKMNSNI